MRTRRWWFGGKRGKGTVGRASSTSSISIDQGAAWLPPFFPLQTLTRSLPAMALSDRRSSLIPVPILPRNVGSADLASQALDSPLKGRSSPAPPPSSSGLSPSTPNHHRPEHYAKLGLTRLPISVVSESPGNDFVFVEAREGEQNRGEGTSELTFGSFLFLLPSLFRSRKSSIE